MIVMLGALASVIGSGISAYANWRANEKAYSNQRALNRQKYEDMIHYAKLNGATPSSIVSGITGSAGGSVPTVSTSNNPTPDFGSTLSSSVNADASQKQAVAAQNQSQAALTNAETERQLALMKLQFEPAKYFADIRKSLADAFKSTKEAFLHGSMKQYYDELTKDVQQVRPWKLAGLRQGLLNDMATFNKIVQDTNTSKAQEGYFKAGAVELGTRSDLNRAETEKTYSEKLNIDLQGFRLQWENTLLSYGIDPNKPFWENTSRLMFTNPSLFRKRMDMFISSLNAVDERLQFNLGEHYKRNIALGVGLYQFDKWHQQRKNMRNMRNNNTMRTVQGFIPFLGGSTAPVSSSVPLMPWGDVWQSPAYKNRWNAWLNE